MAATDIVCGDAMCALNERLENTAHRLRAWQDGSQLSNLVLAICAIEVVSPYSPEAVSMHEHCWSHLRQGGTKPLKAVRKLLKVVKKCDLRDRRTNSDMSEAQLRSHYARRAVLNLATRFPLSTPEDCLWCVSAASIARDWPFCGDESFLATWQQVVAKSIPLAEWTSATVSIVVEAKRRPEGILSRWLGRQP